MNAGKNKEKDTGNDDPCDDWSKSPLNSEVLIHA